MKKIIITGGIFLLLSGGIGGFILGKSSSSNQSIKQEKTDQVEKKNTKSTANSDEKMDKEATISSQPLSEEQTEAISYKKDLDEIIKTMDAFIDAYDNSSTENYQDKMSAVFPLMTERAQEYVSPYFEDDKNMVKIESELDYVHHYVKYSPGRDYASVLSLLETKVRFNGEKTVYGQRILTKCELVLEGDTWKVDERTTKNFTDNDPRTFFE